MQTVLTGLVALAILTLFGLPVLAFLRDSLRVRLLPALPVFGVIFIVIVSAALNWALPMRVVAWIVLGVAIAATVSGFVIARPVWRRYRFVARYLPLVVVVALVAGTIAWLPSFLVGSPLVVQPSSNSDAIWYVASARWITDHPLFAVPDIGTSPTTGVDGVLFGPPIEAQRFSTRLGQESVLATVSVLTGIPLVEGFSSWLDTWAMLGVSGAWVIGEAFRMRVVVRIGFGVLFAVSAALVSQVLAQNASSVLAAALLPVAIGLVASSVARSSRAS